MCQHEVFSTRMLRFVLSDTLEPQTIPRITLPASGFHHFELSPWFLVAQSTLVDTLLFPSFSQSQSPFTPISLRVLKSAHFSQPICCCPRADYCHLIIADSQGSAHSTAAKCISPGDSEFKSQLTPYWLSNLSAAQLKELSFQYCCEN